MLIHSVKTELVRYRCSVKIKLADTVFFVNFVPVFAVKIRQDKLDKASVDQRHWTVGHIR